MVRESPKIIVSDEAKKGTYSNVMRVAHSPFEFTFDFGTMPIGPEDAGTMTIYNRIIMSPSHAKIMLKALKENINTFEEKFGKIKLPEPAKGKPGVSSSDQVYIG
ncbi:MAG: DUF3467 domain-containing protein [Candidatus Hydrothermarchaeaceae archaeon]